MRGECLTIIGTEQQVSTTDAALWQDIYSHITNYSADWRDIPAQAELSRSSELPRLSRSRWPSAILAASATPVRVGLMAIRVGTSPFVARRGLSKPQTRPFSFLYCIDCPWLGPNYHFL